MNTRTSAIASTSVVVLLLMGLFALYRLPVVGMFSEAYPNYVMPFVAFSGLYAIEHDKELSDKKCKFTLSRPSSGGKPTLAPETLVFTKPVLPIDCITPIIITSNIRIIDHDCGPLSEYFFNCVTIAFPADALRYPNFEATLMRAIKDPCSQIDMLKGYVAFYRRTSETSLSDHQIGAPPNKYCDGFPTTHVLFLEDPQSVIVKLTVKKRNGDIKIFRQR